MGRTQEMVVPYGEHLKKQWFASNPQWADLEIFKPFNGHDGSLGTNVVRIDVRDADFVVRLTGTFIPDEFPTQDRQSIPFNPPPGVTGLFQQAINVGLDLVSKNAPAIVAYLTKALLPSILLVANEQPENGRYNDSHLTSDPEATELIDQFYDDQGIGLAQLCSKFYLLV